MATYLHDLVNRKITPQSEPIPGELMSANHAGGYTFVLDCWARLDRFLILGSQGGSYYVKQQKLTRENALVVEECAVQDARRTIDRIVAISDSGQAPKNEPAIFALALVTASGKVSADNRHYAYEVLPKVCRIPTHLFHFVAYRKALGGSSMGLRKAIARWYNASPPDRLAYHLVKYQSRDGWSHRDLLRQVRPVPIDTAHSHLYRYAVGKEVEWDSLPPILSAYRDAHHGENPDLLEIIRTFGLTHEMIPTERKTEARVWEALLEKMPLQAMVRNLGNMSKSGLLESKDARSTIVKRLHDTDYIHASRLHPLPILVALKTYAQGHGMRGSGVWNAHAAIVDALDDAFYLAFDNVAPTGKRLLLACDVSGSMDWPSLAGLPITPREATAALALIALKVEGTQNCEVVAFSTRLMPVPLSPRQRLDDVLNVMKRIPMGGTDCAQPMLYALQEKREVDAFCILTDNETWAGAIHPIQALRRYRETSGIPSKLCTVGMESTEFSIGDPNDRLCLDVVGFDTSTPQVMSQFIGDFDRG